MSSFAWRSLVIAAALLVGTVSVVLGWALAPLAPEDAAAMVLLTLLAAAGGYARVEVSPHRWVGVEVPAVIAAVLLYGPIGGLIAGGLGTAMAYLPHHDDGDSAGLAIGTASLGATLAGWAAFVVSGSAETASAPIPEMIPAALLAAIVFYGVISVAMTVSHDIEAGVPLFRSYWRDARTTAPHQVAMYLLGALAALVGVDWPWALALIALPMAIVVLSLRQKVRIGQQTWEALQQLADLVDLRDPYTAQHSYRVELYTRRTCATMALPGHLAETIGRAARVHDVGKMGMSGAILTEARPLNDEEWLEMKKHPEIGAAVLGRLSDFKLGTTIVLHHHERWDGRGYPHALSGTDIPLGSRVIAVCDTFDAMTTNRPYRAALTAEVAFAELRRCAGTQFDPECVAAFLAAHEAIAEPLLPAGPIPAGV